MHKILLVPIVLCTHGCGVFGMSANTAMKGRPRTTTPSPEPPGSSGKPIGMPAADQLAI